MKIAILGTRGIPNSYGGFEQFAEILSQRLAEQGHAVDVYNPTDHDYAEDTFNQVNLVRAYSNESLWRSLNTFIFDFISMVKTRSQPYDVLLQLGYHPAALFYWVNRGKGAKIVTNMAGMEWQRSKWNGLAKRIIRYCERKAVEHSDVIVSDNDGIKDYFERNYDVQSPMIAYGAHLFSEPDESVLAEFTLVKRGYYMMMARFQPDNNFDMVLDGFAMADTDEPIIVIGNHDNDYGRSLVEKYRGNDKICFLGGIYDYDKVSSLRWYCKRYFHGHSCGGTNPSLLEAMASNACISAYDNEFNRAVLKEGGEYFASAGELAAIIRRPVPETCHTILQVNRRRIEDEYSWERIASQYQDLFLQLAGQ